MSQQLGTWLRRQRLGRGWTIREMARRLCQAAKDRGDKTVPGVDAMIRNIRRWESGVTGVSERHTLYYCKALGIPPERFGPRRPPDRPAENTPASPATAKTVTPRVLAAPPATPYGPPDASSFAYRWMQEPDLGDFTVEREVLMAAHEGSEHAERAERRDIGEATIEQLRADVVRLSREYMTGEPLPLFLEMRRVRSRMHAALDRRLWPRDATELYFLLGCLNGLMAIAAKALGYPQSADELVRAGWAYATAIDHRPLMARLRMESAGIAYFSDQARHARDLAHSALAYLSDGPNAALVHLVYGQAAARLGDADSARNAITAAKEARDREHTDELIEIGGEFNFSRASQHFYAGATVVQIPGAEPAAITELEHATQLYAAGPEPGEDHSGQCKMLAHVDLATAELRANQLDTAISAIAPVLALPTGLRTKYVSQRLTVVRSELARPAYQNSPQARELDEWIEDFTRETIATEIGSLAGGLS